MLTHCDLYLPVQAGPPEGTLPLSFPLHKYRSVSQVPSLPALRSGPNGGRGDFFMQLVKEKSDG